MNPRDLMDIYLKLMNRLDFLWNFYTFFIIALGGYFLSNKSELVLTFNDKVVLLGGYILFVSMNVGGLFITIKALQAVADAVYHTAEASPGDLTVVRALVHKSHFLYKLSTVVVHAVMLCLIMWLVLSF